MSIINYLDTLPGVIGAANLGGGVYRLDFIGSSRLATAQEIADASALQATEDLDAQSLLENKAALRAAYQSAVTRLQQISATLPANNSQRDAAIQDLAKYMLAIARIVKGLL